MTPDMILSSGTVGTEPLQQTFTISRQTWDSRGCRLAYPRSRSTSPTRPSATTAQPARPRSTVSSMPAIEYHVTSVPAQPTPGAVGGGDDFPGAAGLHGNVARGHPRRRGRRDPARSPSSGRRAPPTTTSASSRSRTICNDDSVFTYDRTVPARGGLLHDPRVPDGDEARASASSSRAPWPSCCARWGSRTPGRGWGTPRGSGTPDTGVWHVTTEELHAWVEVVFPTYGWLAFEPTPSRTNPIANEYQIRSSAARPGRPGCPAGSRRRRVDAPGTTGNPSRLPGQLQNLSRRELSGGLAPGAASGPASTAARAGARRWDSSSCSCWRSASWWRWRSRPSGRCGAGLGCAEPGENRAH